ncbi:MAG: hypothetical protein ISS65_12310 [Desulfobacterales bacterium]|nr:hypothetical protein [Desulfobacterales bacterium]
MTDQLQQTNPDEHRYYPDDEIELMDYLLVIWKWKYLIIAGTLVFAIVAALISFTTWKQQPNMYRTNMVLKPGILKIDEGGKPVFVDSPENIKALIEGNLKYNVLDYIKSSNVPNLSNSAEFKVDISQGSKMINVSLESSDAEQDKTKLNYLIKTLLAEFENKIKLIQEKYERVMKYFQNELYGQIEKKKIELTKLLFEEERIKNQVDFYQQKLREAESTIKYLNESKDRLAKEKKTLFQNIDRNNIQTSLMYDERILENINLEIMNRNAFNNYFDSYLMAKDNLFSAQARTTELQKEIKDIEKTNASIQANFFLQQDSHKKQNYIIIALKVIDEYEKWKKDNQDDNNYAKRISYIKDSIAIISKEIEQLEKEKPNIQNIQVIQPPITTELPKTKSKIKRNIVLSSVMGLFLMIFVSFFLEYLRNYKSKRKASN